MWCQKWKTICDVKCCRRNHCAGVRIVISADTKSGSEIWATAATRFRSCEISAAAMVLMVDATATRKLFDITWLEVDDRSGAWRLIWLCIKLCTAKQAESLNLTVFTSGKTGCRNQRSLSLGFFIYPLVILVVSDSVVGRNYFLICRFCRLKIVLCDFSFGSSVWISLDSQLGEAMSIRNWNNLYIYIYSFFTVSDPQLHNPVTPYQRTPSMWYKLFHIACSNKISQARGLRRRTIPTFSEAFWWHSMVWMCACIWMSCLLLRSLFR